MAEYNRWINDRLFQTHHRGQASTLLFQAGVDVGVTDLLAVIPRRDA